MDFINSIVSFIEKILVVIKNMAVNISPKYGDLVLLGICLLIAYFYDSYRSRETGWKIWLPIGLLLYLLFKLAGG